MGNLNSISVFPLFLPFVILLVNSSSVVAETLSQKNQKAPETADQLLDKVCDVLKAKPSFSVDMDVTYDDVLDSGAKVQYSAYQTVWVEKPNRLRSEYIGDQKMTNFYYNGESFTLEDKKRDLYVTKPAPKTLDAALDQVEAKYGITIPMSNLTATDPCADIKADVSKIIFIGNDMVDGEPMYHLLLIGSDRDFQIWVTRDAQPVLRKAIITYKTLPGSPQYTAVLYDWNFNPTIPAGTFTFKPSKQSIGIDLIPITGDDSKSQQ